MGYEVRFVRFENDNRLGGRCGLVVYLETPVVFLVALLIIGIEIVKLPVLPP